MKKADLDKVTFDLDKIVFMTKSKTSLAHIRSFKRFCKVLCTNLVDSYPAKKQHMQGIVREILNFSRCKMRLLRYGFTQIGLHFFQQLLTEVGQLNTLKGFFTSQASIEVTRVEKVESAIDFFFKQSADVLAKDLLLARTVDAQSFIRKSVFQHVAELGPAELKLVFQLQNFKLIPQLFNGIKDEEVSLSAMQTLLKINARLKVSADKDQLKLVEKAFKESQLTLLQLAMPTSQNVAAKTPTLAIPLLLSMANFFPNALSEQSKKHIASGVHSGDAHVRDEAANFMLGVCSNFDDVSALLEIQKPQKVQKEQDGQQIQPEEITINFMSEPNKSKKQLQKLVSVVNKFVMKRSDFSAVIKQVTNQSEAALQIVDGADQEQTYLTRMLG